MAAALMHPASAGADTATCTYQASSRIAVAEITPGSTDPISVGTQPSSTGDSILVEGLPCGGATRHNTDTIALTNVGPGRLNGTVFLDLTYGFGPGFSDEVGSSDEIEFEMNFGGAVLQVHTGTPSAPVVPLALAAGGNEINLNATETDGIDADVVASGISTLHVSDSFTGDFLRADGGEAGTASSPAPFRITTFSGGNAGDDTLFGGSKKDELYGGVGDDHVSGGDQRDVVHGGTGLDVLEGGPGDDVLTAEGGPGRDRDSLSGGSGTDTCNGSARDVYRGCERIR